MKKTILIIFFGLAFNFVAFSQGLPKGYDGIELRMGLEQVKSLLMERPNFGYRGERDVSLLPGENRVLIETNGTAQLNRCFFQFSDEMLYTITINFRQKKMDFFSVFSKMTEKYGEPTTISADVAQWQNDEVIITLERPSTLKYIDKVIFERLQNASETKKSSLKEEYDSLLDGI
ncbi:MAG: hypothetical protein IIW10_05195 [Spirochaetaceae bacterium]|nr:hypothetical protein [Spirochaetaceae bacterium]